MPGPPSEKPFEELAKASGPRASCTKRVEGAGSSEVFVLASPSSTLDDQRGQFASMATNAREELLAEGFAPSDIVSGWLHLAATPVWPWQEALASAWQMPSATPLPITPLLQAPAAPSCYCSLLVHAIHSRGPSRVWRGLTTQPAASTVLRAGARHLRLTSITPRSELAPGSSVAELAYDMLAQASHALTARGLTFKDVVRTWIFVRDIHRNYESVNQARNRFFGEQQIVRLPASTCIEGTLAGSGSPLAMDLYAVSGPEQIRVQAIPPGSMGEATAYGSSFARGSHVDEPGRSMVYLSGTASIDANGAVVSAGSVAGQLDCMLGNARGLLDQFGMDFGHVAGAIVYLKRPSDYGEFLRAASTHGLPAFAPTAVVVADICRPEWLCEIELCAAKAT
jgi:enamine deaminase RidA (YjgF/YER057c/UK114 family)